MSLPTPEPAPTRRARTGLRTVVIAVLAGALTLGAVIGGTLLATGGTIYAQQASIHTHSVTPSDSWATGSTQLWSTTIDTDASVFTSPGHLFSVKTDGDNAQASALTAYTMSDSGLSQAWSASVDTTGDSVAERGADNPLYPAFLIWGKNTIIHGRTLYDITTGSTSDVPWPTDAVPVVAGDTVVACRKTICAGYSESQSGFAQSVEAGSGPLWSTAVESAINAVPGLSATENDAAGGITREGGNYVPVITLSGANYVIIAHHYVINIDTGQALTFDVPEEDPAIYAIVSTDSGWAIRSAYYDLAASSAKEAHLSFYDIGGGKPTSTQTIQRSLNEDQAMSFPRPMPVKYWEKLFVDNDTSSTAGTNASTTVDNKLCVQSISMTDAATIDLSGFDTTAFPCFDQDAIQLSDHAKVVAVGMKQVTGAPFSLMYDAKTGEQITFEGMDPASGASFTVVDPRQIIGYSPSDGTLTSYAPRSR